MKNKYVQYGCGFSAPENWRNFDGSPTLWFERLPILSNLYTKNSSKFPPNVEYGNIVKGLSIPDNSCRGVYCSHILEHLSLEDCRVAFKNTFKILEAGGIFRLVVPDLEHHVQKYIRDSSSNAASTFLKETYLGRKERRDYGLKSFLVEWLGNSRHLWMWDFKSIREELENADFDNIRKANYGDCVDPMFIEAENVDRWTNCLGVECCKP